MRLFDNINAYRDFICLGGTSPSYPLIELAKARSGLQGGRIYMQVDNGSVDGHAWSIQDGQSLPKHCWMHIVGVVDHESTLVKLYINGQFRDSEGLPSFDLSGVNPLRLRIGWSSFGNVGYSYYHYGLIDEVRIYYRALSEAEIESLYCEVVCGDVNEDWVINSADVVYLINYLFKSGPAPDPLCVGDVNCDGITNSADVVYLINYLFKAGPLPSC